MAWPKSPFTTTDPAACRSPPASTRPLAPAVLERALTALHWPRSELHREYPPRVASAGTDHLVVGLVSPAVLDRVDHDDALLGDLMANEGWTTVHAFWPEAAIRFHARNVSHSGGGVEDPATCATAAALGGYLRDLGHLWSQHTVTLLQGHHIGASLRVGGAGDTHPAAFRGKPDQQSTRCPDVMAL